MFCTHEYAVANVYGNWHEYGLGIKQWKVCKKCGYFFEFIGFIEDPTQTAFYKDYNKGLKDESKD
jgi:hypothetical protein